MRLAATLALVALAASACGKSDPQGGLDAGAAAAKGSGALVEAAENEAADAGPKVARKAASAPKIDLPAGGFRVGSMPGDRGREASLEPAMLRVELGAYAIDRYLYPNDPSKPPTTGVTRERAAELCAQSGARLCTELEWERACKGPEDSAYPTGSTWDPACAAKPAECASGYGALGMSAALREWTASDLDVIRDRKDDKDDDKHDDDKVSSYRAAAVRGARASAPAEQHRCAKRWPVDATASAEDIGFRCCHGPPNAATVPPPKVEQTYRKAEISSAELTELFKGAPQLASLGAITFFDEQGDPKRVFEKADAGAPGGVTVTTLPLAWSPVAGEEILVVTGRSGKDSFIVAFYRLPDKRYRIASTLILKDDKGPIVLGYSGYNRKRVTWATCWECRAESGFVTYRDDGRVVITQK